MYSFSGVRAGSLPDSQEPFRQEPFRARAAAGRSRCSCGHVIRHVMPVQDAREQRRGGRAAAAAQLRQRPQRPLPGTEREPHLGRPELRADPGLWNRELRADPGLWNCELRADPGLWNCELCADPGLWNCELRADPASRHRALVLYQMATCRLCGLHPTPLALPRTSPRPSPAPLPQLRTFKPNSTLVYVLSSSQAAVEVRPKSTVWGELLMTRLEFSLLFCQPPS